jgi:hypothetical protein
MPPFSQPCRTAPDLLDRVRADDGPGDVLVRLPALGLRLPAKALPAAMPAALRGKIMGENAARLYARRLNRA